MILKAHSLRNAPTHFLRKRVSTTSQVEIYDFFLMNSVLRPLMKLFALITLLIKIEIFMLCIVPIYVFAFVIGICSCHLGGISVQLCIPSGFGPIRNLAGSSNFRCCLDRPYSIHPTPIIDNQKYRYFDSQICRNLGIILVQIH